MSLRCVCSENLRIAVLGLPAGARKRAGAGYHDVCVNYSLRRRQVLTGLNLIFRVILQKNMSVTACGPNDGQALGAKAFFSESPITSMPLSFALDIIEANMVDYGKLATNIFR